MPFSSYQSGVASSELFGVAVGEVLRQADAVVGGRGSSQKVTICVWRVGVEFDQPFAKAMADHAVANDDDGFLPTCSVPGSAHGVVLSLHAK